ncbi:MAG: NUDIX domain-containing protein [Hyphomicrobiaceae bacterium]
MTDHPDTDPAPIRPLWRDRIIAKVLQRKWRLSRGLTMGAQMCVINADNQILLIRHGYRRGWHFPGGGVEFGESILESGNRELLEEAGVIPRTTPELFGIYTNFAHFPGDHIALFVVREFDQPTKPKPSFEIQEQGFFSRDALPAETVGGARRRLAEIFDNKPRITAW